jgi:hypothetical protein
LWKVQSTRLPAQNLLKSSEYIIKTAQVDFRNIMTNGKKNPAISSEAEVMVYYVTEEEEIQLKILLNSYLANK